MSTRQVPYRNPLSPLNLQIPLEQLRVELSLRIHNLSNARSTGAFMDTSLCYFEPALLYQVAVSLVPSLDYGPGQDFTNARRHVIKGVVDRLRQECAIEEGLLRSPNHYCGKFRVCLGRGCGDPTLLDVWLVPVQPAFFWGEKHPGVPGVTKVIQQRRLTGLAALRWVTPLGLNGRTRI